MTLKELLESLGFDAEQIEKILAGMKENKIFTSAEENIDERYGKLKGQHEETGTQLKAANKLIKELQDAAKGNEGLQTKVAEYEKEVAALKEKAAKAERDSAIKVELLAKGAVPEDIDYLMFKLDGGDAEVKVGEDGKLTGMDAAVEALKTKFPKQFAAKEGRQIEESKLPGSDGGEAKPEPSSLADALRAHYETPSQ